MFVRTVSSTILIAQCWILPHIPVACRGPGWLPNDTAHSLVYTQHCSTLSTTIEIHTHMAVCCSQELLSLGTAAIYAGSGFLTALLVFAVLCLIAHLAHCFIGRLPNAGINEET